MSDNRLTPAEIDMIRQLAAAEAKAVAAETATLVANRVIAQIEQLLAGAAQRAGDAARQAINERLAQVDAFKGRR